MVKPALRGEVEIETDFANRRLAAHEVLDGALHQEHVPGADVRLQGLTATTVLLVS
jgi:hypothetical protein